MNHFYLNALDQAIRSQPSLIHNVILCASTCKNVTDDGYKTMVEMARTYFDKTNY